MDLSDVRECLNSEGLRKNKGYYNGGKGWSVSPLSSLFIQKSQLSNDWSFAFCLRLLLCSFCLGTNLLNKADAFMFFNSYVVLIYRKKVNFGSFFKALFVPPLEAIVVVLLKINIPFYSRHNWISFRNSTGINIEFKNTKRSIFSGYWKWIFKNEN